MTLELNDELNLINDEIDALKEAIKELQIMLNALCQGLGIGLHHDKKTQQVRISVAPPNVPGILSTVFHDMTHIKNGTNLVDGTGRPIYTPPKKPVDIEV